LAFERKLDPSDALFYAGQWGQREQSTDWEPVSILEKSVRGTISNRLKTKDQDPAKLDAAIENPNLQRVDVAALPADVDTLKVSFTLRVLPGTGHPSACNDADYQAKLLQTVQGYIEKNGFTELAKRYAGNLTNGRFLWRNRIGAESVEVNVAHLVDGRAAVSWSFDALSQSVREFSTVSKEMEQLAGLIEAGLKGQQHVLLQVTAFVRIGQGQEVFPSQELILDRGRGDKSKTLYHVNKVAAIHSQKIGNALRTIDTWYEGASELGPIAVEPYGSVTTQGKAYRQPKQKMDFYTLLDAWVLKDQVPNPEQQHFVIATLIRGGVFGDSDKG
ncbi:MAG: type I-F CRISPR-associated protein Csy3, partial [Marinospirillum sp.]|uniref:type I-F CRISPR-associated protein Csy3 n=1 Tax=Marinospirillum sp. TaxID=2183934 RepID=UPI001A08C628